MYFPEKNMKSKVEIGSKMVIMSNLFKKDLDII
jgi:hypothetical protein